MLLLPYAGGSPNSYTGIATDTVVRLIGEIRHLRTLVEPGAGALLEDLEASFRSLNEAAIRYRYAVKGELLPLPPTNVKDFGNRGEEGHDL